MLSQRVTFLVGLGEQLHIPAPFAQGRNANGETVQTETESLAKFPVGGPDQSLNNGLVSMEAEPNSSDSTAFRIGHYEPTSVYPPPVPTQSRTQAAPYHFWRLARLLRATLSLRPKPAASVTSLIKS